MCPTLLSMRQNPLLHAPHPKGVTGASPVRCGAWGIAYYRGGPSFVSLLIMLIIMVDLILADGWAGLGRQTNLAKAIRTPMA